QLRVRHRQPREPQPLLADASEQVAIPHEIGSRLASQFPAGSVRLSQRRRGCAHFQPGDNGRDSAGRDVGVSIRDHAVVTQLYNDMAAHLSSHAPMPDEVKNYITPGGFKKLQEELARLWRVDRPPIVATAAWAAGNGDRSENADYQYAKRKLREIDRRIRYLSKSLDHAVVVDNAGK